MLSYQRLIILRIVDDFVIYIDDEISDQCSIVRRLSWENDEFSAQSMAYRRPDYEIGRRLSRIVIK